MKNFFISLTSAIICLAAISTQAIMVNASVLSILEQNYFMLFLLINCFSPIMLTSYFLMIKYSPANTSIARMERNTQSA